jgi:hypothetical protein
VIIEVLNPLSQVMLFQKAHLVKGKLQEVIQLNNIEEGIYLVRLIINSQLFLQQVTFQK